MPQLLPYYWVNQITFTFVALFLVTYIISVYIVPAILELIVARSYVTKL